MWARSALAGTNGRMVWDVAGVRGGGTGEGAGPAFAGPI